MMPQKKVESFSCNDGEISYHAVTQKLIVRHGNTNIWIGTNENIDGIISRAGHILNNEPIDTFVATGRPEKVILQAVLLKPKHLYFLDLSLHKTVEAWDISKALLSGKSLQKTLQDDLDTTFREVMGADKRFDIPHEYRGYPKDVDYLLSSYLLYAGISLNECFSFFKNLESISVFWGNLKEETLQQQLRKSLKPGKTLIDISNIPMHKRHWEVLSELKPAIAFALCPGRSEITS